MIHPTISLYLGKTLSRSSRNRQDSPELQQKKEQGLIAFAEKRLKEFDIVAMGHSHQPKLLKIQHGWYVNSGDWIKHNSYCFINHDQIEIKYNEI